MIDWDDKIVTHRHHVTFFLLDVHVCHHRRIWRARMEWSRLAHQANIRRRENPESFDATIEHRHDGFP